MFYERALDYAQGVVDGDTPACIYVKQACQRFLDDLKRAIDETEIWFDVEAAEKKCRTLEKFPHVKGKWAAKNELLVLSAFQIFIVVNLFGFKRIRDGKRVDLRRFREAYVEVPRKNGKALDVNTPVATPDGWKKHGDLKTGDYVFSPEGQPVLVEASTGHYIGPCMSVRFSDGSELVAHELHEWHTDRTWFTGRNRGSRKELPLVETKRISETLTCGKRGDYVHRIPVAGPIKLDEKKYSIHPYLLGIWLGDGHTNSAAVTTPDKEVVERFKALGESISKRKSESSGKASVYGISDGKKGKKKGSFQGRLRDYGVLGNKHIPEIYLRGSIEQRFELLRGLIDSDGYISKRGQIEITTKLEHLAKDIHHLVATLGMKPTILKHKARLYGKSCGYRYRVTFFPDTESLFSYIPRKQGNVRVLGSGNRRSKKRTIVSVEGIGERTVNCIQVQGGFYLAGESLIPTHNTFFIAGVGLIMLTDDDEFGAEVYCGATSEKQALEVFTPAKLISQRDADFREHFGVEPNAKSIVVPGTGSKFEPVIGNPGDGASPSCGIADEFHEHKDSDLVDTFVTGMGAREQPLMLIITTAGADMGGPCYEKRDDVKSILSGDVVDDTVFGIIYTIDEGDRWDTVDAQIKANPNYGVSVNPDYLAGQLAQARRSATKQVAYKTKHLNLWVGAKAAWMNMLAYQACTRRGLNLDDFKGQQCYIGIDLASKVDIASMAILFPPQDNRTRWAAFLRHYLPEECVFGEDAPSRYKAWQADGWFDLTPGNVIDFDRIEDDLIELRSDFEIKEVPYDPFQATQFAVHMVDEGFPMVEFGATVKNFSEPMKELEAMIIEREIEFEKDPVLNWMFGNVVAKTDKKENIFPDKERKANKIDGVVALIMALGRAIVEKPVVNPYTNRGLRAL